MGEALKRNLQLMGEALKRNLQLMNWCVDCMDKRSEGLDIRNLSTLNKALLR